MAGAETDEVTVFLTLISFKAVHIFLGFQLVWPRQMNSEAHYRNVKHSVKNEIDACDAFQQKLKQRRR